jgi:hypothetical protein
MHPAARALHKHLVQQLAPGSPSTGTKRKADEAKLSPHQGRLAASPAIQGVAAPGVTASEKDVLNSFHLNLGVITDDKERSLLMDGQTHLPKDESTHASDLSSSNDSLKNISPEQVFGLAAPPRYNSAPSEPRLPADVLVTTTGSMPDGVVGSILALDSFEVSDMEFDDDEKTVEFDNLEFDVDTEAIFDLLDSAIENQAGPYPTKTAASLTSGHSHAVMQSPAPQQEAKLRPKKTHQYVVVQSFVVQLKNLGYSPEDIKQMNPQSRLEVINHHQALTVFGFQHFQIASLSGYPGALKFLANKYKTLESVLELKEPASGLTLQNVVNCLSKEFRKMSRGAPLNGLERLVDVGLRLKQGPLDTKPAELFKIALQGRATALETLYRYSHRIDAIFKKFPKNEIAFKDIAAVLATGNDPENVLSTVLQYLERPVNQQTLSPSKVMFRAKKIGGYKALQILINQNQ